MITCVRAQDCWKELYIWHHLEAHLLECSNFRELFFKMLQILSHEQMQAFAMTLWSLWTSRNYKLWENQSEGRAEVLFRGSSMLLSWEDAIKRRGQMQANHNTEVR